MARRSYDDDMGKPPLQAIGPLAAIFFLVLLGLAGFVGYNLCRIEVPSQHIAVLTKMTGKELPNDEELATSEEYKGIQLTYLSEGRHFRNPYVWNWEVIEQVEVEQNEIGVIIKLYGDELPVGQVVAAKENQKGIQLEPIQRAGLYPQYSNPHAYRVEKHPLITVPAGYHGVVTRLIGDEPVKANELLVQEGERGVQAGVLPPGIYGKYNPYVYRVTNINTRTQTLRLSEQSDMGFPSSDGFWIRLDGYVRFRVIPDKAPEVFVIYNENYNGEEIYDEIVEKVIMPNARSFCRLAGSSYTGRDFIKGETREEFQQAFQTKMVEACEPLGIEIEEAAITEIYPPRPISQQLNQREIAKQQQEQYMQEIETQKSEASLKMEQMRIEQKRRLIEAEREVIEMRTKAEQEQQVAVTLAEQELAVAQRLLEAAKDQAAAVLARGDAEAQVIRLDNEAEASGLRAAVSAFQGNGFLYAQNVLFEKVAPRYQQLMLNSADSPLMRIFERFETLPANRPTPAPSSETSKPDQVATTDTQTSSAADREVAAGKE